MSAVRRIASLLLLLVASAAAGADSPWAQLGPFDHATGAPILLASVVAVPGSSTLYAGGSRGVFRSDDGGTIWVDLGQPGGAETSLLILDPFAPRTVYAATNKGVFKTTDGDATWEPSGLQDQGIYGLAVDPAWPHTLYAGTWPSAGSGSSGFVFKSPDGGQSWSQIDELHNDIVTSFGVDPRDSSIVFAGTLSGRLLRSGDAGETWAQMDFVAGAVYQVVPDPVRSGVVYSRWRTTQYVGWAIPGGTLRQTRDGGATWSDVAGLPSVDAGPFVIDPNDANFLYSETYGSLYRSSDGGESWDILASAAASGQLAVSAGDARYLYSASESSRATMAARPGRRQAGPPTRTSCRWRCSPRQRCSRARRAAASTAARPPGRRAARSFAPPLRLRRKRSCRATDPLH